MFKLGRTGLLGQTLIGQTGLLGKTGVAQMGLLKLILIKQTCLQGQTGLPE